MQRIEECIAVSEDRVYVVLGPGRVDHDEACLAEGICVVVHEDSVVPSGQLSAMSEQRRGGEAYSSFAPLRMGDDEIAWELVCPAVRFLTLDSIVVLMVG